MQEFGYAGFCVIIRKGCVFVEHIRMKTQSFITELAFLYYNNYNSAKNIPIIL